MELIVVCLSVAFTVAVMCAAVLIYHSQQAVTKAFQQAHLDTLRETIGGRKHETEHSVENRAINAMVAHSARDAEIIDALSERLMAFTSEGREAAQIRLTNESLRAEAEAARMSADRAAEAATRLASMPRNERMEINGDTRSVGMWGDTPNGN